MFLTETLSHVTLRSGEGSRCRETAMAGIVILTILSQLLCELKITNDVFLFSRQREDGRQDGEMDQENAP